VEVVLDQLMETQEEVALEVEVLQATMEGMVALDQQILVVVEVLLVEMVERQVLVVLEWLSFAIQIH
tara:strand:+ start:263 stop:463 length:201 start_codon:yes stop_codon:yes gene_type:complete